LWEVAKYTANAKVRTIRTIANPDWVEILVQFWATHPLVSASCCYVLNVGDWVRNEEDLLESVSLLDTEVHTVDSCLQTTRQLVLSNALTQLCTGEGLSTLHQPGEIEAFDPWDRSNYPLRESEHAAAAVRAAILGHREADR